VVAVRLDPFSSPGMPALFSGSMPVEFWSWGPLVLVVQRDSLNMADVAAFHEGRTDPGFRITHYPLSVFVITGVHADTDPLGHILGITSIEISVIARLFNWGRRVPMLCSFWPEPFRQNHGRYQGPVTLEAVREACFGVIGARYRLSGEPVFVRQQEPMVRNRRGTWLEPGGIVGWLKRMRGG